MSNSYLPLHQKYRPNSFDDLVGQEIITTTLKQALITNKIAPAYLFCGPRGTGKTSSARILARSLNCLKSNEPIIDPCGKCEICKTISNGTALDIIEIDAASNTGVDNIRDLIEKSRFAPVQARWKVYVIDECHMLSTAAFNALLKTLEEPPLKSVFILATTDPQRLLPTIISRCQRFDFRRISSKFLEKNLEKIASYESIKISSEALNLIAARSQGGLRDAQRMLDQLSLLPQPIEVKSVWDLLGEVPEKELISLASALINDDPVLIVKICRSLIDNGNEPIAILQGLVSILRDLIINKSAPNEASLCSISQELYPSLCNISEKIDQNKLIDWQFQLKGAENQLRQSYQPRLWLEVLLIGMLSEKSSIMNHRNIKEVIDKKEKLDLSIKESSIKNTENIIHKKEEKEVNNSSQDQEISNASLKNIWNNIISKVNLPSTRMLLSQQAKLIKLTEDIAEVNVTSNWIGMIQSRKNILEEAIIKALGTSRKVIIVSGQKTTTDKLSEPQPSNDQPIEKKDIESQNENLINSKTKLIKNNDIQKNNEKIDDRTQKFADFFNGKIIDS